MQPLQPDTSYHIFNHANGFENVFREAENYRYFLEKYRLYISPIAETYAYCLMPNHFHLVVRIRKRSVIEQLLLNSKSITSNNSNNSITTFSKVQNFGKGELIKKTISNCDIEKYLSKQFANFFSCYTQSFNKSYKRMGSLFIKNFKREPIDDKQHFFNVVIYTHRNPIHHGFRNSFEEWGYSSYFEIIHNRSEFIEVEKLLKTFGGSDLFIDKHQQNLAVFQIDDQPEIIET
jgi:REP element-mobilizing transposase RayT